MCRLLAFEYCLSEDFVVCSAVLCRVSITGNILYAEYLSMFFLLRDLYNLDVCKDTNSGGGTSIQVV